APPATGPGRRDRHAVQRRQPGPDCAGPPRPAARDEEPAMTEAGDDTVDETPEPLPPDRADGSTELDQRETFHVLFTDPAVRNFTFTALGALGMIFLILFQQNSDIGGLMVVIVGVCGVLLRWPAAPVFVILFVMYFMWTPTGIPGDGYENKFEI